MPDRIDVLAEMDQALDRALDSIRTLEAQRDELLAALERIVTYSRDADCGDHCSNACMYCQARAAIRKAKGEQC